MPGTYRRAPWHLPKGSGTYRRAIPAQAGIQWSARDDRVPAYAGMTDAYAGMTDAYAGMTDAYAGMTDAVAGMTDAVAGMTDAVAGTNTMSTQFAAVVDLQRNTSSGRSATSVSRQ